MINFRELDIIKLKQLKDHHSDLLLKNLAGSWKFQFSLAVVTKINLEMIRRYDRIY